jgi:HEAT repeat protein
MARRSTIVCCALACAILCTGAARAQDDAFKAEVLKRYEWSGEVSPLARSIAGQLRASRRAGDAEQRQIAARLTGMGAPAVGDLLEIMVQGRVPKSKPADAPQLLSVPQRALVLDTIARLPATTIRTQLEERLASAPTDATRMAAISVLGAIGNEGDIERMGQLAPLDESGELTSASRPVLREAWARVIRRTPRSYDFVASGLHEMPPALTQEMLEALSDVGDGRALAIFFQAARSRPAQARTAVALVPLLSPSSDVSVSLEFAAWLRGQIDPARTEWTRAVFNALGTLDEGNAVMEILPSLESEELPVRESALAALRKISGLALPCDKKRWQSWYGEEIRWLGDARALRAQRLQERRAADVVGLLREYGQHRLFKSDLAADLAPFLDHPDPAVRALTCETLGRIGSQAALRNILPLLDDSAPTVSAAARSALAAILGKPVSGGSSDVREMIFPGT